MSIVPEFFLNFFDKSMPRKTEVQDSTKKRTPFTTDPLAGVGTGGD